MEAAGSINSGDTPSSIIKSEPDSYSSFSDVNERRNFPSMDERMVLDAQSVFVRGFPPQTTVEQLAHFFIAKVGTVTKATIMMNRQTGHSLGYAYVQFASINLAQKAIQMNDNDRTFHIGIFGGKPVDVILMVIGKRTNLPGYRPIRSLSVQRVLNNGSAATKKSLAAVRKQLVSSKRGERFNKRVLDNDELARLKKHLIKRNNSNNKSENNSDRQMFAFLQHERFGSPKNSGYRDRVSMKERVSARVSPEIKQEEFEETLIPSDKAEEMHDIDQIGD